MSNKFGIRAEMGVGDIVKLLQNIRDQGFDYREWSMFNAELFEEVGRMIREGYANSGYIHTGGDST